MNKFKVGDKVKLLEKIPMSEYGGIDEPVGSILTIAIITDYGFRVDLPNNPRVLPWPLFTSDKNKTFELVNEVIPEKNQYNFFESEMIATFDCDDTLVMWDIGSNHPYDMWAFTEQEKCKPEDVVRIEDPYKPGEAYYLVKHNRHIKLLHDYKARGFGIVVWSAGGAKWAKAVTDALGLNGVVDLVMAKPNRHVDDMPCTAWMGERIYIDKNKH